MSINEDIIHVIAARATFEGRARSTYVDECETKILADGSVQLKQERPWVE
ncbi:MAG: hypothetical protein ABJE95_31610 [Byssovorax sp.]